ncbi:unnamed protein product [Tuber aestivum]|uniref:BZIP domain-containing protein n=1 Tax=Tuber aestivum TaxID=59557 RepID=A0A292Q0V6_9PEZI|nr:unnamed protein product [Tuber aestivum]
MSIRFGRSGNGYDSSEVMETEDDDWRKVTDLNERRKIQNRLAQRNYRRKLRQRLEELERQAGKNSGPSTSVSSKKRAKQPTSGAGTITETSIVPGDRTGSGPSRGESSHTPHGAADTEGRFSTIDSLLSPPSVSGGSEDSSTSASSRGVYTSDFSPLLLRPTARSSENTYPIWQNPSQLQYPEPPNYGSSQSYIANTPEYPPTTGVPAPSVSPTPTHQQLQAYTPPRINHSLSAPLTDSLLLSQDSNTSSIYRPNVRQTTHIETPDQAEFPTLSPTYSPNPITNPNPNSLHSNPTMPRDDFYLTLNHSKLFNATMTIGKILNVNRLEMLQGDTPPPFVRETIEESLFRTPHDPSDLQRTKMQKEIQHHPYIDVVPLGGFRDMLLGYVQKGEETGDYADEVDICNEMHES